MTSNEEVLQMVIIGIPRVAERIAELPDAQRASALKAVETSYLQTLLDLKYVKAATLKVHGSCGGLDWTRFSACGPDALCRRTPNEFCKILVAGFLVASTKRPVRQRPQYGSRRRG
jgi:hypothetical protein